MGDEIRDANVVRLWRDPSSAKWCGLLGPSDGRGLMAGGFGAPHEVLAYMARKSRACGWPFDQSAPGPRIEIPSGVTP